MLSPALKQYASRLIWRFFIWFFHRLRYRQEASNKARRASWIRRSLRWFLVVFILCVDIFYVHIPIADSPLVRDRNYLDTGPPRWSEAYKQPLDFVLCPTLRWGCRYLTVDHRTLVQHVWKPQAITDLRVGGRRVNGSLSSPQLSGSDIAISLAGLEGVFLRRRILRFANFNESRMYGADMGLADLSHATLRLAQLQGAFLRGANMFGVKLFGANLSRANLEAAHLEWSDLGGVKLRRLRIFGQRDKLRLSGPKRGRDKWA